MFGFLKQIFISAMVYFRCNLSSVNLLKCISMSNQECKVRPGIVNVNSDEPVANQVPREIIEKIVNDHIDQKGPILDFNKVFNTHLQWYYSHLLETLLYSVVKCCHNLPRCFFESVFECCHKFVIGCFCFRLTLV